MFPFYKGQSSWELPANLLSILDSNRRPSLPEDLSHLPNWLGELQVTTDMQGLPIWTS